MAYINIIYFLFLASFSYVASDDCITYDFENGLDTFIFDHPACASSDFGDWSLGSYDTSSQPHPDSNKYITPAVTSPLTACISSFAFFMAAGSTIEVNVYTNASTESNIFNVFVVGPFAKDHGSLYASVPPRSQSGWSSIRFFVPVDCQSCSIVFMGAIPDESIQLLVDSFRYIAPTINDDQCEIYDEVSTTVANTTPESMTTTQQTDPAEEGCISYDFEEGFGTFITNHEVCSDSDSFGNWNLGLYDSLSISRPHPDSSAFITPAVTSPLSACISSFVFGMEAGGTVEVNVYIQPENVSNIINAFIIGPFAKTSILASANTRSSSGWTTIQLTVPVTCNNCSVVLMGTVQNESVTLLVDSFRYIPPTLNADQCKIYEDVPTTDPNTTPESTTTEEPDHAENGCISYDFEDGLNTFIMDHEVCSDSESFGNWTLGLYDSISIPRPHPDSNSFITPAVTSPLSACISSFVFGMVAGGTVEVNVYIQPEDASNIINAFIIGPFAKISVLASVIARSSTGWTTVQLNVPVTCTSCSVVLMGTVPDGNVTLLVDSFRYIPPTLNADQCNIYDDVPTTDPNTTPESTTTEEPELAEKGCISYDFEDGLNTFITDHEVCSDSESFGNWTLGLYDSISIPQPHPHSNSFITPAVTSPLSACISSFVFGMEAGGTVEVNVYIQPEDASNIINAFIIGPFAKTSVLASVTARYSTGWTTIQLNVPVTCTSCSIVLMGTVDDNITLLVDSFRYIPPISNGNHCDIYEGA